MKGVKEVFGVTGLSVGLGIVGEGISGINAGIGETISQAGVTSSGFIAPMVNFSMGGKVIMMVMVLGK